MLSFLNNLLVPQGKLCFQFFPPQHFICSQLSLCWLSCSRSYFFSEPGTEQYNHAGKASLQEWGTRYRNRRAASFQGLSPLWQSWDTSPVPLPRPVCKEISNSAHSQAPDTFLSASPLIALYFLAHWGALIGSPSPTFWYPARESSLFSPCITEGVSQPPAQPAILYSALESQSIAYPLAHLACAVSLDHSHIHLHVLKFSHLN